MAMKKCKECEAQVSTKAKKCPQCGAPVKEKTSLLAWLVLGLLVFGWIGSFSDPSPTRPRAASDSAPSQPDGTTMYVHQVANVRAGPSTEKKIVGQLQRGESLLVIARKGKWAETKWDGVPAFVHTSLLHERPLPPLEITSFNWYTDSDFGSKGSVVWHAEVRNNTPSYIESSRVQFSTYDKSGALITTDFGYVTGLAPGSTAATKGYATYFGTEDKARIQLK